MNEVDRLACAPPEELVEYGVTTANADLRRPGPELQAVWQKRADQLRAERLLGATGAMTVEQLQRALATAAEMLGGTDGSAG